MFNNTNCSLAEENDKVMMLLRTRRNYRYLKGKHEYPFFNCNLIAEMHVLLK